MSKEKPATKICKHCKSEIPYGAKVCPQCRKKQSMGCLPKVLIGIAILAIIGFVATSGDDDSKQASESVSTEVKQAPSENAESKKDKKSEEKTTFSVGEAFTNDDMKLSFIDAGDYTSDNEFIQPESGNKYVYAEFEIENLGSSDLGIGSWSFQCYADDYSCEESYVDENSLTAYDSISAGKKIKGKIYFEVPEDSKDVVLEYETNFWTDKKITFVIQ